MRLFFIKNGTQFLPSGQSDVEKFSKLPNGELSVDIRAPRSLKHHRKLFAILRMALSNWRTPGEYADEDALLDALKMDVGFTRIVKSVGGIVFFTPKSISFEECDQTEFKAFYDKVVSVLAYYFDCSIADIEDNSVEYHS